MSESARVPTMAPSCCMKSPGSCTSVFTLIWPRLSMVRVLESWRGRRVEACSESAVTPAISRARRRTEWGSPIWAATCSLTISSTFTSGARSLSTPSRVSRPRASMVTEGVITRPCERSTSMTSRKAWPTLRSLRSLVPYWLSRPAIWLMSRPWSTSPSDLDRPSSASLRSKTFCVARACSALFTRARSPLVSDPVIPRSIQTICLSFTMMLPGCGSAWKKPLSTTCVM